MSRVIAVDIDEVLVPFLPALGRFYTRKTNIKTKFPQKYSYHYAPLFNITENESSELVREFYESSFHANLRPIKNSKEIILNLSENNTIVAVTGRQSYARDPTEKLLENIFKDCISDIIYCDHFTDKSVSKGDVCKNINAQLLIDDNKQACLDCLSMSIPAINFVGSPVYPWCELSDISIPCWDMKYFKNYL